MAKADALQIKVTSDFGASFRTVMSFSTRGEIRDLTYENQQHRASGLNFLVTAIIVWNTRYLEKAVANLRAQGEIINDTMLARLSPLGWEHIDLTGDYIWNEAA